MHRLEYVAGLDEVGRGPLAGDVYAAAVVLNPFAAIAGLEDSKRLTAKRRDRLDLEIREKAVSFCVASADAAEIDDINILQASMLAMQRAFAGLSVDVGLALVDGNRVPDLPCAAEWCVGGDGKYEAIKAASIVAKVARDREMERLDEVYPEYGFARHKGYPTREHLEALRVHGPSPVHRLSFAPCRVTRKTLPASPSVKR